MYTIINEEKIIVYEKTKIINSKNDSEEFVLVIVVPDSSYSNNTPYFDIMIYNRENRNHDRLLELEDKTIAKKDLEMLVAWVNNKIKTLEKDIDLYYMLVDDLIKLLSLLKKETEHVKNSTSK